MFFDYPPSEEIMQTVLEKVCPIRIHYMYYDLDKVKSFDYLKTMLGMIKYVCKSKDGKFDLNSSACFLGITNNMVETLLELFEDCKSINITERTEDYFIIKFIKQISTENLKNSENYNVFVEQLSNSIELRKHYLECDINELTTI